MVRSFSLRRYAAVAMATLLAVTIMACSRQEEITTYEESDTEAPALAHSSASQPSPAAQQSSRLTYETPDGWLPGRVGGMRKAAFRVEKDGQKIDITAIDLAAGAGALLPNVNRWRQQIQLGEITQEELDKVISSIEVAGVKGHYVELIGAEDAEKQQAILGVVIIRESQAWFFKLWGDKELALQEKERFQAFAKSVKFETSANTGPKMPAHGDLPTGPEMAAPQTASGTSQPLKYTTPEGWTTAKVGGMRKAAFQVKEGEQSVEITAIDLAAAAGELLPNINRWRGQVKLEEITQEQLDAQMNPIQIAGQPGHYVELIGPKDAERPSAILGVIALRQDKAWFFKMTGDTELALREKERFEEFVKSVSFVAEGQQADKNDKNDKNKEKTTEEKEEVKEEEVKEEEGATNE